MSNIAICMTCRFRAQTWTVPGYPACTKDGIGVNQHAKADSCPMDFYRNPPQVERVTDNRSCIHRGDVVREVECVKCNGRVMLKVLACQKHSECSFSRDAGVACCVGCPDRRPPE